MQHCIEYLAARNALPSRFPTTARAYFTACRGKRKVQHFLTEALDHTIQESIRRMPEANAEDFRAQHLSSSKSSASLFRTVMTTPNPVWVSFIIPPPAPANGRVGGLVVRMWDQQCS